MAKRKIKKKIKKILLILIILLLVILGFFIYFKYKDTPEEINLTSENNATIDKKEDETNKIKEAKLTMVGDIMFEGYFYDAINKGYDINDYFKLVKHYFDEDDLSIGNLEVVIGNDELKNTNSEYSFCAPSYIGDLISSLDFQVLSTANNHAYDKGVKGVNSTIDYFKNNTSIKTVGTYKDISEVGKGLTLDINGIKFGFLAYTMGNNVIPAAEDKFRVSLYREQSTATFTDYYKNKLTNEISSLRNDVDVLIILMHWGQEMTFTKTKSQIEMADFLNKLGVDIVYGGHSHTIEPIEWVGSEHKTLIYNSFGNFTSQDDDLARTRSGDETYDNAYQLSILSTLNIKVDNDKNVSIENVKTIPIINWFNKDMSKFILIPYDEYNEDYESTHLRYNLGFNKQFIKSTYEKIIDESFR